MASEHINSFPGINQAFAYLPKEAYSRAAALFIGVTLAYTAGLAFYRLVASPVAGFPGPKIAAATGWYEFYYDYFHNGMFLYEIEKMHDKYGEPRPLESYAQTNSQEVEFNIRMSF